MFRGTLAAGASHTSRPVKTTTEHHLRPLVFPQLASPRAPPRNRIHALMRSRPRCPPLPLSAERLDLTNPERHHPCLPFRRSLRACGQTRPEGSFDELQQHHDRNGEPKDARALLHEPIRQTDVGGGRRMGLSICSASIVVGPHDAVAGENAEPGRSVGDIDSIDVRKVLDFERLRDAGDRGAGTASTIRRTRRRGSRRSQIRTTTTSSSSARCSASEHYGVTRN